jgi:anti-sigma factor RsiW
MRELSDVLSEANCEQGRSRISLQLDGELSEFEQALLTAHLERCAACQRFQAALRALSTGLRDTPPATLNKPVRVFAHGLRRGPAPALAAALLAGSALALASLLGSSLTAESPTPQPPLIALHDGNLPTPTGLSSTNNQIAPVLLLTPNGTTRI